MSDQLARVLDVLGSINPHTIREEQRELQAIRGWAMRQIGIDYAVGDRVQIVRWDVDKSRTPGRWLYREALAPGATAIVEKIDFSPRGDEWVAGVRLDREWSVHERMPGQEPRRYWNGPSDETPEGMTPAHPSGRRSEDRRHIFLLRATDLRKAPARPTPGVCPTCGANNEE